jgi:hypothetical protein
MLGDTDPAVATAMLTHPHLVVLLPGPDTDRTAAALRVTAIPMSHSFTLRSAARMSGRLTPAPSWP